MPVFYKHFGDAAHDALTSNADRAARHAEERDAATRAAFDRFHATARTDRKAAVAQLHTDMKRAGGPVPQDEEK
ncbi:hypothetical protein [Streptomyces sp. SID5910]|uniref:hypothetical protein n=1 Tax=Streptomyces sp. SID5910 TaxID=2690312 RepID=UPI001370431A|nr:hypothetical protein [Streptomyces sp. SID5910]MYR43119.1 hypothetical protein [Streptomyces sp. SID5910]